MSDVTYVSISSEDYLLEREVMIARRFNDPKEIIHGLHIGSTYSTVDLLCSLFLEKIVDYCQFILELN